MDVPLNQGSSACVHDITHSVYPIWVGMGNGNKDRGWGSEQECGYRLHFIVQRCMPSNMDHIWNTITKHTFTCCSHLCMTRDTYSYNDSCVALMSACHHMQGQCSFHDQPLRWLANRAIINLHLPTQCTCRHLSSCQRHLMQPLHLLIAKPVCVL